MAVGCQDQERKDKAKSFQKVAYEIIAEKAVGTTHIEYVLRAKLEHWQCIIPGIFGYDIRAAIRIVSQQLSMIGEKLPHLHREANKGIIEEKIVDDNYGKRPSRLVNKCTPRI